MVLLQVSKVAPVVSRCIECSEISTVAISDYVLVLTNITFEPLQVTSRIAIQIVSDGITEPMEEFTVVLQTYEDSVLLSEGREVASIKINDETGLLDKISGDRT